MDLQTFLSLPTAQAAAQVRAAGPQVCVFPINGTRRWFVLEVPPERWNGMDFLSAYHHLSVQRQLDLYRLFFAHGIHTLMMPLFGPDLMTRGEAYQQVIFDALLEMAESDTFLEVYRALDVRVRFYGDYRKHLRSTPFAGLADRLDALAARTAQAQSGCLLYGVFAHDATETIAEMSVQCFAQQGRLPTKAELVRQYYGEAVPPVSFFIGFDRLAAFDMPLVATGSEDLYFTTSPSFYIDEKQLREILYDHLFARPTPEPDYGELSDAAIGRMRAFYQTNRHVTLGVGQVVDGLWYPQAQIQFPEDTP